MQLMRWKIFITTVQGSNKESFGTTRILEEVPNSSFLVAVKEISLIKAIK